MSESDCDKSFGNTTKRIIKPGTYVLGLTANNYISAPQVSSVNFFEGGISFHVGAPGYGIGIGVYLAPGAKYKILYESEHGVIKTSFYDIHGAHISFTDKEIFEVPANAAYMCELFRADTYENVDLKFENVAIVLDGGTESYTPYTGQTATLTLPRTIYGGTVDAVTGEGKETWKLLTLDGTEFWIMGSAVEGNHSFYVQNAVTDIPIASTSTEVCTHYKILNYNDGTESAFLSYEPYAYINTKSFNSVEELKAYLAAQYAAGTPVQIAYKLATPTPFTVTGAQPISALSGVNTLLTDSDNVTVTGRADPIKRITDLEDAVASMT